MFGDKPEGGELVLAEGLALLYANLHCTCLLLSFDLKCSFSIKNRKKHVILYCMLDALCWMQRRKLFKTLLKIQISMALSVSVDVHRHDEFIRVHCRGNHCAFNFNMNLSTLLPNNTSISYFFELMSSKPCDLNVLLPGIKNYAF